MDPKTATLLAAAAALTAGPALATPAAQAPAELLTPIPNAVERLQLADAEAQAPRFIEAQFVVHHHHHHHHHHHRNRRWYLQNGYYWNNGAWLLRPRPHHHHHHHHHHHNHY
jgi:hypothetical protein